MSFKYIDKHTNFSTVILTRIIERKTVLITSNMDLGWKPCKTYNYSESKKSRVVNPFSKVRLTASCNYTVKINKKSNGFLKPSTPASIG